MNAAELHLPVEMHPSPALHAFVAEQEGLRLEPYLCPGNECTQGYGHTKGVTMESPTITVETAQRWLTEDLEEAAAIVRKHVTVPLTQGQFDALTSFMFNIGPGAPGKRDGLVWLRRMNGDTGRRPVHSTLLAKLNSGDYAGAAEEFARWTHAGGRQLDGLVKRRARERAMFKEGM